MRASSRGTRALRKEVATASDVGRYRCMLSKTRTAVAILGGLVLFVINVGSGCPGDPPTALPELATTAAVGTLEATTSVTDDGTFTWRAAIPVPPGRAGMQPSLAVSYESSAAESSLGVGFRLDGLSTISRCGQTVAIDGVRRGVHLDEQDRVCLDGARLLAVEGVDLAPRAVYRTEEETWRRVETLATDAGGIAGPVSFLVRMPDGRERRYGATEDSRLVITRSDGQRVVATWYLTDERDPRGNLIQYRYDHVTPTLPREIVEAADPDPPVHDIVRIARIDYTGTWVGDGTLMVSGDRSVRFEYAARARVPDIGFSPDTGGLIEAPGPEDGFFHGSYGWRASTFPLERVRTFVGPELVHELRLVGDDDNAARRYRLSSVQLCANAPAEVGSPSVDGLVCMPETRFEWRRRRYTDAPVDERYGLPTFEAHPVEASSPPVRESFECGPDGQRCRELTPFVTLDSNGDGADDILYWSSVPDVGSTTGYRDTMVLRHGGYRPRITAGLRQTPFGEPIAVTITRREAESAKALDWDLDGRDDLVLVSDRRLIVLRSLGDGRFERTETGLTLPSYTSLTASWIPDFRFELLDIDGDGRRDIAACIPNLGLGLWGIPQGDFSPLLQETPGLWAVARRSTDGGWYDWQYAEDRTDCAAEYGNNILDVYGGVWPPC